MPKYPKIKVKLSGKDGNALAILGNISAELRKNKVSESEISLFWQEATSGDYNKLLCTCMEWVAVK